MQQIMNVSLKMSKDLAHRTRVFAAERDQSRSELLREAVEYYMKHNGKTLRQESGKLPSK